MENKVFKILGTMKLIVTLIIFSFINLFSFAQNLNGKLISVNSIEFGASNSFFKSQRPSLSSIINFKIGNVSNLNARIGYSRGKYFNYFIPYKRYDTRGQYAENISHEVFIGIVHKFFNNNNFAMLGLGADIHYYFEETSKSSIQGNQLDSDYMIGLSPIVTLVFFPKHKINIGIESINNIGFRKHKSIRGSSEEIEPFMFEIGYFTRGLSFKIIFNLNHASHPSTL